MPGMINPIDNTCLGCKYNRTGNEGNCSRYTKYENDKEIICGMEENIGENTDNSCTLNTCPAHCFLDDELLSNSNYFGVSNGSNVFSLSDGINNIDGLFNADTTDKQNFVDGINSYVASMNNSPYYSVNNSAAVVDKLRLDMIQNASGVSISNINTNRSEYNLIDFKCGDTVYDYGDYKLPNVGGKPIINNTTINNLANNNGSMFRGTKWDSLNNKYKTTSSRYSGEENALINDLNVFLKKNTNPTTNQISTVIINNVNGMTFHAKGIDFLSLPNISEWYHINNQKSNAELLRILNYYNLSSRDLRNIYNFSTKKMLEFINTLSTETGENALYNELTEGENSLTNKICADQITEYSNRLMLLTGLTNMTMEDIHIRKLIDIFMITSDDNDSHLLESNLNILLDTGEDPTEEEIIIERIGNYRSILELGNHPQDIRYIEKKVMKFLGTRTEDYVDVFMNHVSINSLCADGFATRPMDILGNLLKLNIDSNIDDKELIAEKQVINRLLRYVPSIMKKVLDISESLEMVTCDRISKKTQLYHKIYNDLFIDSNVLKFELPDLGITEFFKDFNRNIYTKIILLIFIGFVISKIITLFSINVAVKT